MIHRDDAAGVLGFMLESTDATLVVAVDDEPVDKWTLADWLADECGVDRPAKLTKAERLSEGVSEAAERRIRTSKRCSNDRLRELGYEFRYRTFREGYRPAIEAPS
jgi:NAD dependent epimerase/dehydratase family enzyme